MSWITIVWSMALAVCATLALIHLAIWAQRRSQVAHLLFALTALGAVGNGLAELGMMKATTVEAYVIWLRISLVPTALLVISFAWYIRKYFATGRLSLAAAVTVLWTVLLIVDGFSPFSPIFSEIFGLRIVQTPWGERFALANGVIGPLKAVNDVANVSFLLFIMDASVTLWRRGQRRRALLGGGVMVCAVVAAILLAYMTDTGILRIPYLVTFIYVGTVILVGYPLIGDVLRAAQLTRELRASDASLRDSEARINLAANAANFGLWVWNIRDDELLVTEKWRRLFGFAESEPVKFGQLLKVVHPEDRERMKQTVQEMLEHGGGGEHESEYRITRPDGSTRWIAGYGGVELDERGKPAFARGVSRDITQRKIAEEELRESEERFRTVADAAPVLIWMAGVDKLCNFFNKPWLEFTGRTVEQEMGNGWTEGVHPDDLQRCLQTYTAAFDARTPFVMQYRLRRHDGEYRWLKDDGVPRYDTKKNFTGYIGSCVDITESISKEQALRESEERMSLAMAAAKLGLWEWNVSKDELWGTKARRVLLGLPASGKIKLEDGLSAVHADDRDRVRQTLKNAARTGEDYHLEYRVVLPDGSVQWTDHRGRCVRGADGNDLVLRGVSMDVTEQKRAEEKFRLATEASPSGILLVNDQGRIVLVNSQIEKLFGYRREELVGKPVDILVPERFASQHPTHRATFFAAPTARAMGAGRELFARRKDGSEFPVEIGLNPIQTPEGILVLAAVVDISARKLAEEEALRHREDLGHLSRVAVMGELTASIAHELNQPLSGIISNASAGQRFIDRGDVDLRELHDLLADIVADGRRAGDVIRGIQSMVRKGTPARQRVNLNELVTNVLRMLNQNAMLHSCELQTLLDPNLPTIEANPIQLQQVLINLVINSLDAMRNTPPSRRKVVVTTERNGDDTICTSVRDYGVGIPEEARDRIFDHFFTTKADGLGMGLGIVRSIVESHAGTVVAENVEGGGARFHFTLPVSSAPLPL